MNDMNDEETSRILCMTAQIGRYRYFKTFAEGLDDGTFARCLKIPVALYHGSNAITVAAKEGCVSILRYLHQRGLIDGSTQGLHGPFFLQGSMLGRQQEVVRYLVDDCLMNINIHVENMSYFTSACDTGNLDIAKFLHARHARIDASSLTGNTALIAATIKGFVDVVDFLLDLDIIDVDAINHKNETALLLAARMGNLTMVTLLVEKGKADLTLKYNKGAFKVRCSKEVTQYLQDCKKANDRTCSTF